MQAKKGGTLWLWVVAAVILALETAAISQEVGIGGNKFWDQNGTGGNATGDPQLSGWTLILEADTDEFGFQYLANCTTTGAGNCIFGTYDNGTYKVWEVLQDGWIPTAVRTLRGGEETCPAITVYNSTSNPEWNGSNVVGREFEITGQGDGVGFWNWQPTCSVTTTAALPICAGESIELSANTTEGTLNCTQSTQINWVSASNLGSFENRTDTGATWNSDNDTGNMRVGYRALFPGNVTCDDSIRFTVNPLPEVTAGEYGPVCLDNGPVVLGGNPDGGSWNGTGVVDSSFDPAEAGAGDWPLTYTYVDNETGCDNSDNATITVYPLPVVVPGEYGPFCEGDPAAPLTPTPENGTWSTGPGTAAPYLRGPVNGTWYINPYSAGRVRLVYTYLNQTTGCDDSANTTVSVYPLPVVDAGEYPPGIFCDNDPAFALNGTPAGGEWSGTGVVDTSFDPDAAGQGSWTLTYTYVDNNTCENSDNVTLNVEPAPPTPIGGSDWICRGDTYELPTTLTANGLIDVDERVGAADGVDGEEGLPVRWFEDGCGEGEPLVGDPVVVKPSKTTTYYAQAVSTNDIVCYSDGCAEFEVEVRDCAPVPTLNEWGLIVFMLVMAATGGWFILRKKKAA